jgi:UDP-N-acetylmuramate--alanine ligase
VTRGTAPSERGSAAAYVPPEGSIPTLEVPTLSGVTRLHLVGIGGAGMSAMARLLLARDIAVSGSDLKSSRALDELRASGAAVYVGHGGDQVVAAGRPDAVVVSSAVPPGNPEVVRAHAEHIPVWARAQVLAALAQGSRSLAVSGTHGKTTTTSMIAVILQRAGLDPTFLIGGDLNESGTGARHGSGQWFVAESDESDGSFLLLRPEIAVVTNVAEDHLSFYGDGDQITRAFARFFEQAGTIVTCGDDPGVLTSLSLAGREAITYGMGAENVARVEILEPDEAGARGFVQLDGTRIDIALRVRPRHNVLNATAAILAAVEAGVAAEQAADALRTFTGVRRRFEFRGIGHGAEFYDDYAVHPTEVAAVLGAVAPGYRRTVAVLQPHRYSRTQVMWRQLGESLANADVAVITDVYPASEDPIPGVTGKLLVEALTEAAPTKRVVYLPRHHDVVEFVAGEVRPGDVVLTLGAGDITMVADEALERILGRA